MSYPLTLLSLLFPCSLCWPLSSEDCGGWVGWLPPRNVLWFLVEQCHCRVEVIWWREEAPTAHPFLRQLWEQAYRKQPL